MYGAFSRQLQKRMYTAWHRKRAGSVRDRVLLSLQSEGALKFSNCIPVSSYTAASQYEVDTHRAASLENHTDAHCCHVMNLHNIVQSHQHNISDEDRKSKRVSSRATDRNNHRLIITRSRHQNNSNVICVRRPSTVSSYSLKGVCHYVGLCCQKAS